MLRMADSETDFETMLVKAIPHLRAFARYFTSQSAQADDLVQETLIKAWKNRGMYTPDTNFRAWLFTILRNTFLSERRKAKRFVEDPELEFTNSMATGPQQLSALEFADFTKALATLPPDQREAVLLVAAEGFSYDEAARICDCAVGTIKSRINRARKRLSDLLDADDPPTDTPLALKKLQR